MRQLGFSLAEIQACLENPEFSLPRVIDLHRARVREQIALSRTLLKRLDVIAIELETTQTVAVENLIEAMETITMSKQYFTPQQQEVLEARFREVEEEWQDLLTRTQVKMSRGTDLNNPSVQWLARRWQAMMKYLIHGDAEIYESLAKMYQQEGGEGMLLGLLAEGQSQAAQVLMAMGVTFETAKEQISKVLGLRPKPPARIAERLPLALRAKRVLELARQQAQSVQARIAPEHLLLGLLRETREVEAEQQQPGVAAYILKEGFGLDLASLEQQLRAVMSQ